MTCAILSDLESLLDGAVLVSEGEDVRGRILTELRSIRDDLGVLHPDFIFDTSPVAESAEVLVDAAWGQGGVISRPN